MIVEVRTYRIKPGRRAGFIEFFETRAVPARRAHGIVVFGPLRTPTVSSGCAVFLLWRIAIG
jgi:heme-degrading monooxygenase HmoA